MSEAKLNHLLSESRNFGCEYQDALSNHLPMALIALNRIGASDDQLSKFYSSYVPVLKRQEADGLKIDNLNWTYFLGQHIYNSSYRDFFLSEIGQIGIDQVVSKYLPVLVPGLSGGAFHPLIRLAYAIEIKSEWETAEALASWAMAYQELGKINGSKNQPPIKLLESFKILSAVVAKNPISIRGDNVFSYLKSVGDSEVFSHFFVNLNLDQISLSEIADLTIKLYLSTQDSFTALHCVTATHAMRVMSPYLHGNEALKYLWQSVCSVYVVTKCVVINENPDIKNLSSWENIFEVARDHENDHVIKFSYTTHEEFLIYKSPLYQLAAARKTGLINEE
jgi:hypothetical protein